MGDTGERCLVTVDGVDFHIPEPTPWSRVWYSHKYDAAGLRYEIAICIATGWIVAYNGPFEAGSWPDLKIFKSLLKAKLGHREKVVADKGYKGDLRVCNPKEFLSDYHKEQMNTARARHETVNGRIKKWSAMSQRIRFSRHKHHIVFQAVVAFEQMRIMYGDEPFQVNEVVDPIIAWE